MNKYRKNKIILSIIFVTLFIHSLSFSADEYSQADLNREMVNIKYSHTFGIVNAKSNVAFSADDFSSDDRLSAASGTGYKSPSKAFFLSLAVPGLGQYYNGSKVKALAFLGVEATSWLMNIKLNGDGDDLTSQYELFQRTHWLRDNYEQKFLLWTYGVADDELVDPGTVGITHHLPDERTQQYYEMTGKYNQFAWGWDDANLGGYMIDDYSSLNPPPAISMGIPESARRMQYEQMRNDANNKYDQARWMIYIALLNRVVSSFEAMITANKINKKRASADDEFSRVRIKAKLRSLSGKNDTPYLSVTYKF